MKLLPLAAHLHYLFNNLGLPAESAQELKDLLIQALNEEIEACAEAIKDLDAWTGGHGEPSKPGSSVYMETIRKRKIQ